MEWLFICTLLLLSGFFSGSEIAFVSSSKLKLDVQARKESTLGRAIRFFQQFPERFLTVTLVGNNIVNVAYATLMAIALEDPIRNQFLFYLDYEPSAFTILSLQTLIASLVIMLVGEILPKAIFRVHADFFINVISVPQRVLYTLLFPLVWVADTVSGLLLKLIPGKTEDKKQLYHRSELLQVFQELRDSGAEDLDREDTEILHNVLELYTKRVKDVMVPRTDMVAVDEDTSIDEVLQQFVRSGHSKLPVYRESMDDIVGVVLAHDFFNKPQKLSDIIRDIKMVPGSKRTTDLLNEFQTEKISLAVVLDEYGGTAGLVTIEDLLEEVVGDIQDEYDRESFSIKKINDFEYVMDASSELDDLKQLHPELPLPNESEDFETVAGFIIHETGRLPRVNEEIPFPGYKFIISRASPSRIQTVKLVLNRFTN